MEIWKDIEGYEGYYQISNNGRVKSVRRRIYLGNGYTKFIEGRIRKAELSKHGYIRVLLSINGKNRKYFTHRLVANAFLNKIDGCDFVNHINGIKTDNRVDNLEWCTPAQNIRHAIETLNIQFGKTGLTGAKNAFSRDLGMVKNGKIIRVFLWNRGCV